MIDEIKSKNIYRNKRDINNANEIIEGDNLIALKYLDMNNIKVDLIFIDPPYNTNKDFIYNDKFFNIGDLNPHSNWLEFMKVRLKLAKNILNEDGIIYITIDDA